MTGESSAGATTTRLTGHRRGMTCKCLFRLASSGNALNLRAEIPQGEPPQEVVDLGACRLRSQRPGGLALGVKVRWRRAYRSARIAGGEPDALLLLVADERKMGRRTDRARSSRATAAGGRSTVSTSMSGKA